MPSLMAVLGANIGPFAAALNQARNQARAAGRDISEGFVGGLGQQLASFASLAALQQVIVKTVEYGSKVQDLSLRLGMSTDEIQEWDYALKQNGSNIDAATKFFEKLGVARLKALAGSDAEIAHFQKLGISMADLQSMRVGQLAARVGATFEAGGDSQELLEALKAVGGKSATEMIATFRVGFAGLAAEARAVGAIISPETTAALDDAGDTWDRLKASARGAVADPIALMLTALEKLIHGFEYLIAIAVGGFGGMAKGMGEGVGKMWEGIKTFSPKTFLSGLASPFTGAGAGIKDAVGAVTDANTLAEQMQAQKKEAMRKHGKSGLDLDAEGSKAAERDAQREVEAASRLWQAHMDRVLKLEDQLAKKKAANALADLSVAEQILELERRRAALAAADIGDEEGQLENALAIEDIDKEMREARKRQKAEDKADLKKHDLKAPQYEVNSLQRIGGLLGNLNMSSPEMAMIDVQRKSERHLEAIRKAIEKRKTGASDDTLL